MGDNFFAYGRTDIHNEANSPLTHFFELAKKTGFLPKFYVQLLFLPLCDTSPVHFTAVCQIITIIYGEIINVLHTARSLSLPLYYVPVFFTAPSPRRICHLVVLTVDLRDTALHAHTKHRTTLNLTLWRRNYFLNFSTPCI